MKRTLLVLMGVVFLGCPGKPPVADDDHDGVPNSADRCPNEPGPAENQGCPVEEPPVLPPLLLRQTAPPFLTRDGKPHKPQGAIQCCMTPESVPAGAKVKRPKPMAFRPGRTKALCNSLWPMAAECWQDYMTSAGFNFFHFRMGPFYASPDLGEDDFAEIGGPYAGGPGSDWNPKFWETYRRLLSHAHAHGSNVEVNVIDTWVCKHAQWGDLTMPWPPEDVEACGRRASPEQERFIRKSVIEADATEGGGSHVVWITGNEQDQIQAATCTWAEWVRSIIRDQEAKNGGPVRLVGTDNQKCGAGPFDYIATHATTPLQTLHGRHTENNEHNKRPGFLPEQELSNHCAAQADGNHWWFWRAEMSDADFERTRTLFAQGCGGVSECFPPEADDPLWGVPEPRGDPVLRWPIESAKLAVGERCGTDHQGSLGTLDSLGTELRKRGYCAARGADALAIRDPSGHWQEYHSVAFATGCWAQDTAVLPKATYPYLGPPPSAVGCTVSVPPVDEILCKLHQATNHIYDCTPKAHGQPILPEGDPQRQVCELVAMGGASPTFRVDGGLEILPQPNPMQFQIKGSGSGRVTCTVPAVGHALCNLQVSR
jgi:hypothetical protein